MTKPDPDLVALATGTPGVVWYRKIHYGKDREPWWCRGENGEKCIVARRFRVTKCNVPGADGVEFVVFHGATEEEIAAAAHDAIAEYLSYGWDEVTGGVKARTTAG